MNTALNMNVVHESEAQRQHARVRIPTKLRYLGPDRELQEVPLDDLSAGGFSFQARQPLAQGEVHKGRLMFMIDSLGLGMEVEFQVRSIDANGRSGCQFQNLDQQEIATLRTLITSHMAGELVTVGDVLGTLQRENFTKSRGRKGAIGGMSAFGRLRAVTFSLGVFIVGLAAFGFVFKSVYNVYFVSHATSGLVSLPGIGVTMPRDGTVQALVAVNGDAPKGAPMAVFNTSMLDVLKDHLTDAQLTPEKITEMFGKQMTGTLTSPCDCVVGQQLVADGQFASKGQVIFQMIPKTATANVDARFTYRQFPDVRPGTRVSFQVAGEDKLRQGLIVSSTSLNSLDMSSDIRVQIKPDEALPTALAGQPVDVSSDRGPSLNWLMDKAMAAGR
ncbi:alginate biosynthesis protein Alg44 [Pseudomonas sp. HR96]|uniref:alginate biosynthesis protein Alg44 n=1 Tax=Pseudomonas sp. HR96 TaxID=1027966 RepID=UPI002A747477|nr:alginate biosynthesis protein Alg44 [Pseudomonas sp. HR96]WPP00745.1 alginate biosynthesis protein Alg44 [Pseudomonas sp. HR96]